MNKTTQEMMHSVNTLIKFVDNIPQILDLYPETDPDILLIDSYISYEIKKLIKDIVHIERL